MGNLVVEGMHVGASPEQWEHFAEKLNLMQFMYPVVCRPDATPARGSALTSIGKVPSLYVSGDKVSGILNWPNKVTSTTEYHTWSFIPDYGFCINCKKLRCLDMDVDDPIQADQIKTVIIKFLKSINQPIAYRFRENSSRLLFPFYVEGNLAKTIMITNQREERDDNGLKIVTDKIEFLANGQQFQACGLHTSSVTMYQWEPEFPEAFPTLTLEQLADIWQQLTVKFAIGDTKPIAEQRERLVDPTAFTGLDAVGNFLKSSPLYKSTDRNGALLITCPFEHEHSTPSGKSDTAYFPPSNGYEQGHFKCLHGHCAARTDDEFIAAIGYNPFDDTSLKSAENAITEPLPKDPSRFKCLTIDEFTITRRSAWLIKDFLPKTQLAVLYGESGSGKSFLALDMAMAIARGTPWNDSKTNQGRVVYVCAEGMIGFSNRIKAYCLQNSPPDKDFFHVIPAAPNLLLEEDCKELCLSIREHGAADLIIIDTFAQTMPGANENGSEDIGKALAHCRTINNLTKATVLLIHHSGKDASKGARGWSGIKAAADAEIEILRNGQSRTFRLSKAKDGEEQSTPISFELHPVYLGDDDDGERVTSCVIDIKGEPIKKAAPIPTSEKNFYENLTISAILSLADSGKTECTIIDIHNAIENSENRSIDSKDQLSVKRKTRQAIDRLIACGRLMKSGGKILLPENL